MTVNERRNSRARRGLLLAALATLLSLALWVPAAYAQDYPDGGNDSPGGGQTTGEQVGGETLFQDPGAAAAPGTDSSGLAFTGTNVLFLVVLGGALIGAGVWLRRRGRAAGGTAE